jgi:hypothetical protein
MCVTAAPLQDSAILLFEPNEINDGTVFANQTAELFSTEGYVRYDVEILPETSSASRTRHVARRVWLPKCASRLYAFRTVAHVNRPEVRDVPTGTRSQGCGGCKRCRSCSHQSDMRQNTLSEIINIARNSKGKVRPREF